MIMKIIKVFQVIMTTLLEILKYKINQKIKHRINIKIQKINLKNEKIFKNIIIINILYIF